MATQDFSDSSLREVVQWLQDKQQPVVLVDKNALASIGISTAEPVSDALNNAPIYLLLNRLRRLGVDWYYQDEILHLTSFEEAGETETTLPYNVGDLLDSGYEMDQLVDMLASTVAPTTWSEVGGPAVLNALGDVLIVRQTGELQRQVQGVLKVLRAHARQTYVYDPPQHLALRQKLQEDVSVEFVDTPLEIAIRELAAIAKTDIRLDVAELREQRIREREPVTLKLTQRKLETVLQAMLMDLDLTWILRDGLLWVTSVEAAEAFFKTAVYDVRDLCRNADESDALLEAVTEQTEPTSWDVVGGPGSISFAKPGTMVISHQEAVHDEVLELLETYRAALRASKPRKRDEQRANEIITVYYRMHENVARDLAKLLPNLVSPDSWKSEAKPQADGQVTLVASAPEIQTVGKPAATPQGTPPGGATVVVPRAVLIIRQARKTHDEIADVIRRVESGDGMTGGGFGGMGGGGFGAGFFSVPSRNARQPN